MIVERFVLTPFQQNTRIVACSETRKAICIDPGEKSAELVSFVRTNGFELQAITLTHGHLDHIGGTAFMHESFPEAEILLHKDEEPLYRSLPVQPIAMGIPQHQLEVMGMKYDDPPPASRRVPAEFP